MIWKRALLLLVLGITGLVVETSVLGSATLDGSKPELLLLFVVALAINEGPAFGAVSGFVLGIATDMLVALPSGVSALVFTAVGYAVGRVRAQMTAPTAWAPIVVGFSATFMGILAYGGLGTLLGQRLPATELVRHALLSGGYNALLTPFVFPVVRALGRRLRPAGAAP